MLGAVQMINMTVLSLGDHNLVKDKMQHVNGTNTVEAGEGEGGE